jgi:hypothetical protein
MNGEQCLASMLDLYDVAGQQRTALIELQNQIKTIGGQNAD